MRKRKLKNTLWKFGVLLLGILLVLTNCEKENEIVNNPEVQGNIIIKQYHLSELNTNSTIIDSFEKLNTKQKKDKQSLKSSSEQDLYNFTIDSSNVREVIVDNYKSYTFFIKRPNDTLNYFENLIIEENEGSTTRAFIIKYIPTNPVTQFEEHNSFHFEGERIVTRLNLADIDLAYKELCITVEETWCNYKEDHIAGPTCYFANDDRLYTKFTQYCQEEPDSSGSNVGSGGGGGTYGGGDVITSPIQLEDERCPSGSGKIMVNDVCKCPPEFTEDENGICVETPKPDQIIIDLTFENNPCIYAVYEKMGKSTAFNNYLKKFEPEFNIADLKLSSDDNFSQNPEYQNYLNAMAITKPPLASNLIEIVFNTDSSLTSSIEKKPDAYKAVAIIHEMIHAEMYRKMLDALKAAEIDQSINLDWTDWTNDEFKLFIESLENKYEVIYDYFKRYKWKVPKGSEIKDWQHQQMAEHYRNTIKDVLVSFDSNLSADELEALSWLGLKQSDIVSWQNYDNKDLVNSTLIKIKNTFPNGCD